MGTRWPLKLPQLCSAPLITSYLSPPASRSPVLCSPWPFSPSHTTQGARYMDTTSLQLANIFRLHSDNTMTGSGVPHLDPSMKISPRNSGLSLAHLKICVWVSSPHLLPLQKEPEIPEDQKIKFFTGSRELWLRKAVRAQNRGREGEKTRKRGLAMVLTKPFLFFQVNFPGVRNLPFWSTTFCT